jgi:hypothetical protein
MRDEFILNGVRAVACGSFSNQESEYRVYVENLRIGVYIRLELRWHEHPFVFGSFKIRDEDQIETLKQLGIKTVICVPEKSDQLPKPPSLRSAAENVAWMPRTCRYWGWE